MNSTEFMFNLPPFCSLTAKVNVWLEYDSTNEKKNLTSHYHRKSLHENVSDAGSIYKKIYKYIYIGYTASLVQGTQYFLS